MIVDSDILIDFTHGDPIAADWLDRAEESSLLKVSEITVMELLVGSRNKTHMQEIIGLFKRFEVVHVDEQISAMARALIETYFLSHGLLIGDALIASTSLMIGDGLATKNKRDFRFIKGLRMMDYP
ncbi:MAG: type II toxin-antitoxin system VapC family toxin [Acidobacteria bacterium]|nr:type II toxin-antitoxin system VapC family toxin [Acidobacteriota bacterium]